ncbi:pyruvate formate lyase activating enzyme [Alkalispirochaeta americana]|uniref:Pyruvate formate lyase activating enzyme n=1 Tax=Alkalispirochaeta americana TaxID=159291 RepID=A0A1N6N6K5_9SPIO|nr:anaerobic ribonucleoside-triphosphate reductase activating protein [Alkalispirochaeta americana]SIP87738.1 pyruvate formate lyase activating enzyme [Alkalispirochaeta americana]
MPLERLGIQKTTLLDYPGRVAAVLFTHGCPLRCPYCHNPELITGPEPDSFIPRGEIFEILERRKHLLQGVVITGGEPLLHQDLGDLVEEIASLGLAVKLDTSGAFPERLQEILGNHPIDLVALDLKTAPGQYHRVGGSGEAILQSLEVLRSWGGRYLLRTTLAPQVVTDQDLACLENLVLPGEEWNHQPLRD